MLFIAGTHGYEARTILISGTRALWSAKNEWELFTQVIGLLGVARLPSQTGVWPICDLFIRLGNAPPNAQRIREIDEYVAQHRALKWEDEVQLRIKRGDLSIADLKGMDIEPATPARFAKQMGEQLAAASTTHQLSGFGT